VTAHPSARCPLCATALPPAGPARCPSCGAPVGGDTGRRLLALDRRLERMTDERRDLLARFRQEAAVMYTDERRAAADAASTRARRSTTPVAASEPPTDPTWSQARRSASPVSPALAPVRAWLADAGPQTLLATSGVLLLVIAAGVFLAVTWRDLPMPVRGGVVLTAAAASGRLTAALVSRGLARTAEATGVLTLALLAVLADGLWRAGLLDALGRDVGVLAQVSAVLAVTAHVFARATGVRSPLVLAAWLTGTAIHAAGVWLVDPYTAAGVTRVDLLVAQTVNLVAVCAVGVYGTRMLRVVPRWRLATLVAAGVLWTITTMVVIAVLASVALSVPSDGTTLGVGLAVGMASVGVAGMARRIDGPLSRWWAPVGTGGMWWAGTLAAAASLVGRVDAWPDVAVLAPLAVGVALLLRVRPGAQRVSALLGMVPLAVVALRPVVGTAQWMASATALPAPTGVEVVRLGSCLAVCLLAGAAGVLVRRARTPALVVAVGSWTVVVTGGGLTLVVLAPSDPAQVPSFLGALAVVAVAGAVAWLAGRAGGGAAIWWPAGVVLALSFGSAGALAGRLAAWPHLPAVVPLALAAAVVWGRRDGERIAAAVGATPAMLATMWPVVLVVGHVGGVLVNPAATPHDVVGAASLVAISVIALSIAGGVDRVARGVGGHGDGPDSARGDRATTIDRTAAMPAGTARAARSAALAVAGVAWSVASVAVAIDLAMLAPSRPDDLAPFVAVAALAAALAGLASAAGRVGLVSPAVAAGGTSFVVTTATAAAAWGRLDAWPDLPVVAAMTVATGLVWSHRSRAAQRGALIGAVAVGLAALAPVARAFIWIAGELAWRVTAPWPPTPGPVDAAPPANTLASAVIVAALVVAVVRRLAGPRTAASVAVGLGGAVLLAGATAVWHAGGGAVLGLAVSAGAAAAVLNRPDDPAPSVTLAASAVVTAVASLTAPPVTVTTLAIGAGISGWTVGGVQHRTDATSTAVCTAQILGLVAAVAAATTRGSGVPGLCLVAAAGGGWMVAAAVRSRVVHAAAVEATTTVAMVIGLGLAAAADGLTLGVAFATVATASAAVAVWRPDRRWMRWVSSAAASGSSWSVLSDAGVTTVEAYTAPPALLIAGLAVAGLVRDPGRSSWPLLGSALSLLTVPTLLQLVGEPSDLWRLAGAIAGGAVLAAIGRRWSLQSPLVIGVGTAGVAALTQYGVVIDVLPRWLLLALGGALLLWLSISYERQVERLTVARRHLIAMR
jgi:hypothetical protein